MSLWIVTKDLLLFFRDKKSFFTLFLMPIILIAILGTAFGGQMKGDQEVDFKLFKVGINDQDQSDASRLFVSTLSRGDLSKIIDVQMMSKDQLEEELNHRKIKVGLIIQPHFEKELFHHDEVQIDLLKGPNANLQETVLENLVLQFSQHVNKHRVLMPLMQGKEMQSLTDEQKEGLVHERNIHVNSQPVTSIQYYAAGMGVLFLLITLVFLVGHMIEEKEEAVYHRLLVSKLSHTSYIMGKLFGILFLSMIQFAIIILFTSFVFQVHWGEPLTVAMIGFSFILNAAGFGVFIGTFIKNEKTFNSVGILGAQVLAALGGSMVPLYLLPQWLIGVGQFLPNSLALQMFLNSMAGTEFSDIQGELLLSCGMGIAFLIMALFRLSIERKRHHA